MERDFAKPLLDADALCVCREPGSVQARLVRAGEWGGASVGFVGQITGPVRYHRYMQTVPPTGPLVGMSDEHLTAVPGDEPREIAAVFVEGLADDEQIINDGASLLQEIPTLTGLADGSRVLSVEVIVPPGPNWQWLVLINGKQAASVEAEWHVTALETLAAQLRGEPSWSDTDDSDPPRAATVRERAAQEEPAC